MCYIGINCKYVLPKSGSASINRVYIHLKGKEGYNNLDSMHVHYGVYITWYQLGAHEKLIVSMCCLNQALFLKKAYI